MSETYWASKKYSDAVSDAFDRIDKYYRVVTASGRFDLWRASYVYYNAVFGSNNMYRPLGDGYSLIRVNHYHNFLQHLLTMTVNQRPSFEPRATNSDHSSQAQAILARGLLDYYMREKSLEVYLKGAVEQALLYGEGFLMTEWDPNMGDLYAINPDTKSEVRQGDITYSMLGPVDVIRDTAARSPEKVFWYILRRQRNKYDLAANFPELAEQIINHVDELKPNQTLIETGAASKDKNAESDLVTVYTLYHARTPSVPEGRKIEFLSRELVLSDGPLPYRDMPVHRVCYRDQGQTPFGYTVMFDLMPIQELVNGLYSTIKTNQEAFGVQSIMVPKGSGLAPTEVTGGLNFIEYDPVNGGKPEPLQLTRTPAEVFTFLAGSEKLMETLSGVNSVARGDPQASLQSGAALALVQSQAIQFSQGLQHSYTRLLEGVGQSTITILRDYAAAPRVAMIAGKANRAEMREFTGKDLENVDRVQVDQGNPMLRTTAGKVELAQMMIQLKLISTPEQLLQVIQTGNLEVLTEGTTAELLSIKSENETLAMGKQVPVMITDDHKIHIQEHKCVLADPEARNNPEIVKTVTDHLLEHLKILQNPDLQNLLTVLGQTPVPPSGPGVPGPGSAGPGPLPAAPMTANDMAQAHQPNMPQMPINPLTKERVSPIQ